MREPQPPWPHAAAQDPRRHDGAAGTKLAELFRALMPQPQPQGIEFDEPFGIALVVHAIGLERHMLHEIVIKTSYKREIF